MYLWPYHAVDGTAQTDMHRKEGRIMYLSDLRVMATEYLAKCDEFMKEDPNLRAVFVILGKYTV